MTLTGLLIVIVLVVFALWLVNSPYLKIPQPVSTIISIVIVILALVWCLNALGVLTNGFGAVRLR